MPAKDYAYSSNILLVPYIEVDESEIKRLAAKIGNDIADGVEKADPVSEPVTKDAQSTEKKSRNWGRRIGTGIAAGLAAIGFGKILKEGLDIAADRSDAGKILSAQLALNPADAKKAGNIAGKVYAGAYGDSFEEVNGAVAGVVTTLGGFGNTSAKEVQDLTEKVLNLSSAFGVDTADSIQVAKELFDNGMVPTVADGIDYLTTGLQKIPTSLRGDLLDGLKEYTPYMAKLGFTADQTFGLLVAGSENGAIGMDKILDALKEFGIRATDMSTTTVAAYKTLGLNSKEMADDVIAGGDRAKSAIETIVGKLKAIPDATTRSNTAIALFGTQLEDLGTNGQGVNNFLSEITSANTGIGKVTGSAKKMNDTLGSTQKSILTGLSRTFQQTLGEIAIPLLEALNPILTDFSKFITENKGVIKDWAGTILIVGGILAGLFAALSVIGPVLAGVAGIMASMGAGGILAGVGVALAPIIAGLAAIAGPALIAIGVLTALGLLAWFIISNWSGISGFFGDLFSSWGDGVDVLVGRIQEGVGHIGEIFTGVGYLFSNFMNGVINTVIDMFNNTSNTIPSWVNGVTSWLHDITGGAVVITAYHGVQIPHVEAPAAPQMGNGGLVPARPGGTRAILGEANNAELVMNEGLYNRQQITQAALNAKMLQLLVDADGNPNGGAPRQYNIDARHMTDAELITTMNAREMLMGV